MSCNVPWRHLLLIGSDRDQDLIPDGLDAYWRIDSYRNATSRALTNQLRIIGYDVHPRATKESLIRRCQRVDKGLLCYDPHCNHELWGFIQARGLQVESSEATDHARLVQILEDGDSKRPFHMFMDLPAELRANIYEYYICDFPEELHEPTQPPLARTNQQIRKEFLPVFYANHEILLKMTFDAEKKYDLRWDKGTDYFVKSLEPSSLAMLRKINITVREDFRGRGSRIDTELFHFRIELGGPNRDCSVKLTQSIDDEIEYPDFSDSYHFNGDPSALEEEVQATFEVARSRIQDKTPQLKLADLGVARRKMEAWLEKNLVNHART